MDRKCAFLVFESDLNDFDLREIDLSAGVSAVIKQEDRPIGVCRVLYKNGLPITSFVQKVE